METSIYKTDPKLDSHRKNFISCMKLGNSCMLAGKYDQAIEHFAQARQHAYKLLSKRPLVLSRCYMFMADAYQLKGNYGRAARLYDKCIRYAVMDRKLGRKRHEHIAWLRKRAKMRLSQMPEDHSFLVSSLIQLALEVVLKEIEVGGVIVVGFFAFGLAKDVLAFVNMTRKR